MPDWGLSRSTALKALGLIVALGFVFSVQFVPHLATFENSPGEDEPGLVRLGIAWEEYATGEREGYPWAVHVDEHLHAAEISQIQRVDRLIAGDPYADELGEIDPFSGLKGAIHERGYHVLIAQAEELTGVSTYRFYQFLPALWTAFIAFGVWSVLRPHPAAIPSAALVGLIPSTARFLGTGYLVPIGFSLAWIPATLALTRPAQRGISAAVLALLVTTWAFFVHLIAGFACVAVFGLAAIFSAGQARSASWKLLLVASIPVAAIFRAFWSGVQGSIQREERLPIDFSIFDHFGIITLFIWAGGLALLALDPPDDERRSEFRALGAMSLIAIASIVGTVYFDLNKYAMYTRMHMVFFLTAAVPAGYAVARVGDYVRRGIEAGGRRLASSGSSSRGLRAAAVSVGLVVAVAPLSVATSPAVDAHLDEGIYRVMNEEVWTDFKRVEAQYGDEDSPYEVFLTHGWRAPFLTELTGKRPHTVLYPGSPPVNDADWRGYLQDGNKDLAFFVNNDITLVLGLRPPPGDVWEEEGTGIWRMEEPYADQIDRIRDGKSFQPDRLPDE